MAAPGVVAASVPGASGAGARWVAAALRGRVGGGRREDLAVGAVRSGLEAGVGSSGVLGPLVPRRSLVPGRLPGLRGLRAHPTPPAPLVPFRLLQDLGQVLVLA